METVVVHTPKPQQAQELLEYWKFKGVGMRFSIDDYWTKHKQATCFDNLDGSFWCDNIILYRRSNKKPTPFPQYKAEVIDKDTEYQQHISVVRNSRITEPVNGIPDFKGGIPSPQKQPVKKTDELDEAYWQKLRHQAAIAAMQGMLSNSLHETLTELDVANIADEQATALINQLKNQ